MPSRRQYLLAAGAAIAGASAGCAGRSGTGTPDGTTAARTRKGTDISGGTAVGRGGRTTAAGDTPTTAGPLEAVRLQSSFVGLVGGHHDYVYARPGEQYVLVATDGDVDSRSVAVRLDGAVHTGAEDAVSGGSGRPDDSLTVVPVPRDVAPESGSVSVEGHRRPLSATTLQRLGDPPTFELGAVSVPDRADPGEYFRVVLRVAHRGGRRDTFRAAVSGCTSGYQIVETRLSAGDTARPVTEAYACGEGDQRVVVVWRGGPTELTVPAPGSTTGSQ